MIGRLSNPKVFVGILVVLAVLFVVATGCGAARGGRDARREDRDPGFVKALGALLVTSLKGRVGAGDVQAACAQGATPSFVLQANRPCTVEVAGSSRPSRTLALRLAQGGPAQVAFSLRDGVPERRTVNAGQRVQFDVFGEGATLTLACTNACRFDLQ